MQVSIVIPSFNGGKKLAATLDSILRSESSGLERVEIIVVDDGSPIPLEPFLNSYRVTPPFSLAIFRQSNSGPAAARNTGFRAAQGEIVVFIDDDIICPSDLLQKHVAAHCTRSNSVIFGRYPYTKPSPITPFFQYLNSLGYEKSENVQEEFLSNQVAASGHLSVERATFDIERGVYNDGMVTPVAEEFELTHFLNDRNIPLLLATKISALHNRSVDLESTCRQQFSHAIGYAEVACKKPEALRLPELSNVVRANGPARRGERLTRLLKKTLKQSLSAGWSRNKLLQTAKRIESYASKDVDLAPLYDLVLGLYFFAGFRTGLDRFGVKAENLKG